MIGIDIINSFLLSKSAPLEVKQQCVDLADRLLIPYPYKGLVTRQVDTGQLFRYITTTPADGGLPSNIAGDWELVITTFTAIGAPANSKGVLGDIYIDETGLICYKKTGVSTWTALFSISGAKAFVGAGVPGGGLGNNGDLYFRSNGEVYYKSAGTWALQFNIRGTDGVSDKYATTSTTSVDMSTAAAPLAITVGLGLSWSVGQDLVMASRGTPTKKLTGTVVAYNPATGAMTLNPITPVGGAGAVADFDVNINGAPGAIGKAFVHTEADINFTAAKVTAVQAGTWTKANPWTASIANDTRSSLVVPVALSGNMTGHSVAYDGATWYDNGRWLGFKGDQGLSIKGDKGDKGDQGNPGTFPFSALDPRDTQYYGLAFGIYNILDSIVRMGLGPAPTGGTMISINCVGGSGNYIYPLPGATINYRGVTYTEYQHINLTDLGIASCLLTSSGGAWDITGEVNDNRAFLGQVKPVVAPSYNPSSNLTFVGANVTVVNYPSFVYYATTYIVPHLSYTFGGFRSGGDVVIAAEIQFSDDNSTWFNLKFVNIYLQQNTPEYWTLSVVDNGVPPNANRYYRLRVECGGGYRNTVNADYLAHGVLRYL